MQFLRVRPVNSSKKSCGTPIYRTSDSSWFSNCILYTEELANEEVVVALFWFEGFQQSLPIEMKSCFTAVRSSPVADSILLNEEGRQVYDICVRPLYV